MVLNRVNGSRNQVESLLSGINLILESRIKTLTFILVNFRILVHIHKISSRDILDPYLAIGISKELNQESRNQSKILHESESR